MLTTILVLLIVLWLLGMGSSYTLGGFIHILLVIAVAVVLIRVNPGPTRRLTGRWRPLLTQRRLLAAGEADACRSTSTHHDWLADMSSRSLHPAARPCRRR